MSGVEDIIGSWKDLKQILDEVGSSPTLVSELPAVASSSPERDRSSEEYCGTLAEKYQPVNPVIFSLAFEHVAIGWLNTYDVFKERVPETAGWMRADLFYFLEAVGPELKERALQSLAEYPRRDLKQALTDEILTYSDYKNKVREDNFESKMDYEIRFKGGNVR